jgi:hypothetical protein
MLIKEHENNTKINAFLLQILSDIQRKLQNPSPHQSCGKTYTKEIEVMWIDIILRKLQVHMRYKSMVLKLATPEGAPQGRPNMEPRDTNRKIPLVRILTNLRNLLVAKLVPILR